MKKALCFVAILALVASASADVRVFFTMANGTVGENGLDLPENHMVPTVSTVDINNNSTNGWDYYGEDWYGGPLTIDEIAGEFAGRSGTLPPRDYAETPTIDFSEGQWGYVWFQWNRTDDATYVADVLGAKLNAITVEISGVNCETTYYLCNDKNASGNKKWDGTATPPDYPEWHNNPQTMIAILAGGLLNSGDHDKYGLYIGKRDDESTPPATQSRIALLGAVEFTSAGTAEVAITDINYDGGQAGTLWSGFANVVPEPASLLLLGVGGLLLRRR